MLILIDQEYVYFKCQNPLSYVTQKVQNYGFGYSYYTKGTYLIFFVVRC